jgi:hypothetical protein
MSWFEGRGFEGSHAGLIEPLPALPGFPAKTLGQHVIF